MSGFPASVPLGLAGATALTRYVGGTASGAPVSGTFAVGDFVIDQSAAVWVCTVAGSPGTWAQAGSGTYPTINNGGTPWLIDISIFPTPVAQTNWAGVTNRATDVNAGYRSNAGVQNAEVNFDVTLAAGTWTIRGIFQTSSDAGIVTVALDGVDVGTIDLYSAGTVQNVQLALAGVVLATTAKRRLRLKTSTKNGASTSYFGVINGLQLQRTA